MYPNGNIETFRGFPLQFRTVHLFNNKTVSIDIKIFYL